MTILLALALAVSAQAAVPTVAGPSLRALEAVEAGASFDGAVPRQEGPLMILSEEKVLLRSRKRRALSYDVYGSEGQFLYSHGGTPRTVRVYGTKQQVAIVDRKGYVRRQTAVGAGAGLLAGAAVGALLVALANPVGALLALAACAAIGARVGNHEGRSKPGFFSRVIRRTREVGP